MTAADVTHYAELRRAEKQRWRRSIGRGRRCAARSASVHGVVAAMPVLTTVPERNANWLRRAAELGSELSPPRRRRGGPRPILLRHRLALAVRPELSSSAASLAPASRKHAENGGQGRD